MTIYSLDILLFLFGTICCSMSSFICCFLTCIQISQKAGQVVWYSLLFKNFPQFIVIHTIKGFGIVNKAEIDVYQARKWLRINDWISKLSLFCLGSECTRLDTAERAKITGACWGDKHLLKGCVQKIVLGTFILLFSLQKVLHGKESRG